MELSTILNFESSSLQKYLCLRVDVARDTIEGYEEKARVLERHRNY